MKWQIKDLQKIDPVFRKLLARHTPNWHGAVDFMREACQVVDRRKAGSYIAIIMYVGGVFVGWSLLDFYRSRNSKGVKTYIYIVPIHRRRGYGSQLLEKAKEKAKKLDRTIRICPHDKCSTKFFRACNVDKSEVAVGYTWIE